MLPYVDDFLCLASTRAEALRCRERVEYVLKQLGLTRHPEKGFWEPTQHLEHLGPRWTPRLGSFLFRQPSCQS